MKNKIILFTVLFFIIHCTLKIEDCMCQWQTYTLPYDGLANELAFYNLNTGVSCGHTLFQFTEKIYYTSNSGNNWIMASCPPQIRALVNIQFINSSTVYACGAENYYRVFSKGYEPGFNSLPHFIRNRFAAKGISEYFSEYKSAFLKSTNAGMNWTKVGEFDTTTGYINDIHFFDVNTGYAIIDTNPSTNPRFYKTTDGGANWQMIRMIEDSIFLDNMHFFNMNTGLVCGGSYILNQPEQHGVIYKTTNAGLNWTETVKHNVISLPDFTFFNSSTGIAIGAAYPGITKIFKTTNGGNTWDSVYSIQGRVMYNIGCIASAGIAFAVGNNIDTVTGIGKISTAKTTDYGLHWTVRDLNLCDLMNGIALIDPDNFFMSGGMNGPAVILKSTSGGNVFVNQAGSKVPSEFKLEQNYPNPFNAVTSIKFSVPLSHIVTLSPHNIVALKVFDMTGREVTTLVNEFLQPGTYKVRFDAKDLPSGIYFYRLTGGNFSETKKLVLMK